MMLAVGEVVLQLVIFVVFGGVCAFIASGRGRSPIAWFVVGFFAPCIGLIIVLALPDLKIEEERQELLRRENRRLRERMRKNRIVADQRHAATQERLTIHDQGLGMDTSRAGGQASGGAIPPPPTPDDETEWYYLRGKNRVGPFSAVQMHGLWSDRKIGATTLVWSDGMADWSELEDVKKLMDEFDD